MISLSPKELALLAVNGFGAMQKVEELSKLIELVNSKISQVGAVLEIGAGNGGTSWAWNRMFEFVTTIDLPNGPWGGSDLSELKKYLPSWEYIEGDSHSPEIYEQVSNRRVEFLFIDGDHSYEGVRKDFEMYSPLVMKGGLIAFHDICEHPKESGCEVKRFWDEIKESEIKKSSDSLVKRMFEKDPSLKWDKDEYGVHAVVPSPCIEFISEPTTWGGIGVLKL